MLLQLNNPHSPQLDPQAPRSHQWMRGGSTLSLILILLAVTVFGLLFINRQAMFDWWRLRDYQPPAEISRLAEQDTLTDAGRHLFYLNHPELLDSVSTFRQRCPNNKDTIVLGCYHASQGGIFLYKVKDPKLQGVTQVTAAHETLHAAYDRLSAKDKAYVDGLLKDYYDSGQADQRVKDEIALYHKTEPDAVIDEMHSIFGTEIADLPEPLETYYKRYFTDRAAVVAYQRQYQQEFDTRQAAISSTDQQLAVLKQQIDATEKDLANQLKDLQAERSRLNSLSAENSTSYNAAANSYNNQVAACNSGISDLQSEISRYNRLVAARNELAGELATLDKALDTRLKPQSQ